MTARKLPNFFLARCCRIIFALSLLISGCGEAKDMVELAIDGPGRKQIDTSRMGVNNFFVDREFGSINDQYFEIKNVLRLRHIRVLFAWTTDVQPSPSVAPNYSFFDNIIAGAPAGVDILIVLAHTPSWMTNSANWIDGNPRKTWVEKWLKPTVRRYANASRVVGFEVWNEPDLTVLPSDAVLGLEDPANYFELLSDSAPFIRTTARGKKVVLAATRSIQQNFPNNLNYNRALRDYGATNFVDVWNIHYYGTSFESVITNSGVSSFLNSIGRPIWVTESGKTGPNSQLAYVETAWPYLDEKISGIERFYYYQFGETTPIEQNYGLRTTDASFPVSDLYVYLRDR